MEKRKLIKNTVCIIAILSCLIVSSCGGSNTYTDYYTEPSTTTTAVTTTTTTTKPKETTKPSYHMSESTAIKLAEDFLEKYYTKGSALSDPVTDLVVFGTSTCSAEIKDDSQEIGYVKVSGHYWKKDKYGNSSGKTNFTKTVYINKSKKKASFNYHS